MIAEVGRQIGRARMIVTLMLGAYFGLLVGLGGYSQWDRLGVDSLTPFFDLRSVTSAWECARRHVSVIALNPCDPMQRPANYPRIWESPAFLGLGQDDTTVLGFVVVTIFLLGALALVPRRATTFEAIVYGLALCSPAVMLGVARANVDMVLFTLVVTAVLLLRRQRSGAVGAPVLLLFAAILKLFPVLAAATLLRQRPRRALLGCATVLACFGVYALVILDDIRTIDRVTPETNGSSYGVQLLGSWLASGGGAASSRVWDGILLAGALLVAVIAARWLRCPGPLLGSPREAVVRGDTFVAGATIYVFTYALVRSFDYRLTFVLLTVPQLLRWSRAGNPVGVATLVALLATVWLASPWEAQPGFHHLIERWQTWVSLHTSLPQLLQPEALPQLVLFAGLTAGLVAGSSRLPLARALHRRELGR